MKKSSILITGGAGYIGSHVNKLLVSKGYKTVVFDDLSTGHKEFVKWGEFFKGDLSRRGDIRKCFLKHKDIAAVMHFAASTSVNESVATPAKYYSNNLSNTINLLNAMAEFGVKKFIFSSSAAVYGLPKTASVNETHHLSPINPYGRAKKLSEEMFGDYEAAYGIKYAGLRYFNAAGADPDGQLGQWYESFTHLIPLVFNAALEKNGLLKVFGQDYPTMDGTCVRDYVHVCDLAQAHVLALEYISSRGRSDFFNLGNGRGYSVSEVIAAVEKITDLKVRTKVVSRRAGDPAILVASSAKARKTLGWVPSYPKLGVIISTAWEWHRKRAAVGR